MNVIILDDDSHRHKMFSKALANHEVRHARHADDFVREILKKRADIVYLDHDLAFKTQHPTTTKNKDGEIHFVTGADVARFLVACPENRRPNRVIIHSMNQRGAQNIADILEKGGIHYSIRPFDKLMKR